MKKIIALVLIIGCMLALASCKPSTDNNDNGGNGGNTNTVDATGVAAIQKALDDSAPKSADITVKFESTLGTLNGKYDVTYNDDGSATVDYSYERFNTFDENVNRDEVKSTYTGVVTVSSAGEVEGDLGGVASVEAVSFDINLDSSKLTTGTVTANVLKGKVSAANTEAVLGINIGYDVDITITTGSGRVTYIVLTYTTDMGPVEITSIYHY